MASFYDVTDGRMTEFKRVLSQAGFTSEDVLRVIKTPGLAKRMHDSLTMSPTEVAEWLVPPQIDCSPPFWWRTPLEQLEAADGIWPGIAPRVPQGQFIPRTATEVPLLHVPCSFDKLRELIELYWGSTDWLGGDNYPPPVHEPYSTEPMWVAFDYAANCNKSPQELKVQPGLAALEVMSAVIQYPGWADSWGRTSPFPNLSGCMAKGRYDRWYVLGLETYKGRIGMQWWDADFADSQWASPTVREL